jgi:hypothetical protein
METARRCISGGAAAFLVKPVDSEQLIAAINELEVELK